MAQAWPDAWEHTRDCPWAGAFAQSAIGMAITDPRGRFLAVNAAFAQIVGREPAELQGRPSTEITHPDDADRDAVGHARLVSGDEPQYVADKRYVRPDGSVVWVSLSGVPIAVGPGFRVVFSQVLDITGRKAAEERLAHRATHDQLTGLPTRDVFLDHLARAVARLDRRPGQQAAVLFVDVDGLKRVNDGHGHAAGDELLVAVVRRISRAVRAGDVVARMGGDEFTVLVEDLDGSAVPEVAARLVHELSPPFRLAAGPVMASASIGVAATGRAGVSPAGLVSCADAAMYRAKRLGGGRCEVYDGPLPVADGDGAGGDRDGDDRPLPVAGGDRAGGDRDGDDGAGGGATGASEPAEPASGRLRDRDRPAGGRPAGGRPAGGRPGGEPGAPGVLFRPVVDLADGRLAALEVVRGWAAGGPAPARLVLGPVCARVAAWEQPPGGRVPVFVPLRAEDLDPSLPGAVRDALAGAGLAGRRLGVSVAETAVLADPERASAALAGVSALGCAVAVTGFGTGYAGLLRMLDLPLDAVTVDATLVWRLGRSRPARAVVASMVRLAADLGLRASSEGVSTAGQAAALAELGCRYASGPAVGAVAPGPPWRTAGPARTGTAPAG